MTQYAANDASAGPGETVPTYYELFDLASLQFAKVRMIGQAPFVGYTVADFAPNGDPDVSVDTSLLASSEEPEHFIAIASDRALSLDPFTVVDLNAQRDIAPGVRGIVWIDNVTDAKYQVNLSGTAPNTIVSFGMPRTVRAGVQLSRF